MAQTVGKQVLIHKYLFIILDAIMELKSLSVYIIIHCWHKVIRSFFILKFNPRTYLYLGNWAHHSVSRHNSGSADHVVLPQYYTCGITLQ